MYNRTYWFDQVKDQQGHIIRQGVPMDSEHYNNMEIGISDGSLAHNIMMFKQLQTEMNNDIEVHTLTLSMNSGMKWPFNNKETTVALAGLRENTNYSVEVNVLSYSGGRLGSIRVVDRARNGFKLLHDGSATTVNVAVRVSGGMTDPGIEE
ncbi:MAG: hypothetical protein K6E75_03595 [Lachnospiraceae bacterium]|nr:hypothetical protein [Lachnospiraceae bacterium]